MNAEQTFAGALIAAVASMASAIALLWRTSERRYDALDRRTESHLAVSTELTKLLVLMEVNYREVQTTMARVGLEQGMQLNEIERKVEGRNETEILGHAAQMKTLATIEALLLQRSIPPIVGRRGVEPDKP